MEGDIMTTTVLSEKMPETYEGLLALFIPRTVHDDVDLKNITEIIDHLAILDNPTADQAEYLDTLSTLVASYEDKYHEIDISHIGPLETLKFLLGENEMSGSDLGRLLGQRQLGSKILRGERKLSKSQIKKLAEYFHVDAGVFL